MTQKKMIYEQPEMQSLMLDNKDVITISEGVEGSITTNKGTFGDVFGR